MNMLNIHGFQAYHCEYHRFILSWFFIIFQGTSPHFIQVFGLHLVGGPRRAGLADRGPLKVPREEHVPDEGLDGRLAHETHKEELLNDGGGHRP